MAEADRKYGSVFLEGSVLGHIVRMASAAYTAMFMVQVSDILALYYVSKVDTEQNMAALGVSITILFLSFIFNLGFSTAIAAFVARGAAVDCDQEIKRKITTGIASSAAVSTLASAVLFLALDDVCSLFGLDGEAKTTAASYLSIVVPLNGVQAISMAIAASMRALGKAREGMWITLSGSVGSLVVDPYLILYLGMGVEGAAYGLLVGRIVQINTALFLMRRAELVIRTPWTDLLRLSIPLLSIAIPATIAVGAAPVAGAVLMLVVAPFGDAARSAIFVVDRISNLVFGFTIPLATATGSIIAQNHAVKKLDRAIQTANIFIVVSILYISVVGIALHIFGKELVIIFNVDDPVAIELITFYLSLTGVGWLALTLIGGANAIFQNTGRPSYSVYVSWGRATLGMLPSWIAAVTFGDAGAAISGYILGLAICALISMATAHRMLRKESASL